MVLFNNVQCINFIEYTGDVLAEPMNRYLRPSNHYWCRQIIKYITVISIL